MKISFNNFRYFRVQIFLSFSTILVLMVIWFLFYAYIDRKIGKLNDFTDKTYNVSKDFSTNVKNFQSFLLTGYKEKEFYVNRNQRDIDLYINNLKKQKKQVLEILNESKRLNIDINHPMTKLSSDIDSLYKSVIIFKEIALARGFKDYGFEGEMRSKAHLLENNSSLDKITLLQLRRHEKDYLLRADEIYFFEFDKLINSTIKKKSVDPYTKELLIGYKNNFRELVNKSSELGLTPNLGLYGKINYLNVFVEDSFLQIINLSKNKVNQVKSNLFYFQLFQTILIGLLALFLSVYVSRYFTKDLQLLTMDISNYIKSNFKDNQITINQSSPIREVDFLLKSYGILREKLTKNIEFLEKATEQANNSASFKTQFLANMSHEIRSPLNGVIGMLNMLKTKSLTNEQIEYVEIAEHSADHLLGLVNMILDHSKMEAGKMNLEYYPINLKKELAKLIRLFEYRIKDKNIELHFIFDDAILSNILGDNLRLQQVLINLLDNAIKFTPKGDVRLEVKLINIVDEVQYIGFKVMDSGIGIDANKTEQILLAFEQADLSTTRKYGGTGLGLTISNQLIQLMGGTKLNIAPLINGGSSFNFEIPFRLNLNEVYAENIENDISNKSEICVNKALIVEDNIINQKVLYKLLEKINIKSDIANNGKEAVLLYQENEYDMIFMDLHMPEMDGFEATAIIKNSIKYQKFLTPIIAVTASAFDEDKVKAISNGMDDFITKPIVLKNLEETIIKQINLKVIQ
ncbi:response regulator [Flavobacterium sp.]|uniref:response regulator n=1 Tax=Flavobacterium sp. TaxID=239 RepID=UPI00391BE407